MADIKRHDPRDKELPFEPDGLLNRVLTAAARKLNQRGSLWRTNFTVSGTLGGRPLRVPLQFGTGWEHLRMREVWMFDSMQQLLADRPGAFVDVGVNVGHTLVKVKAIDPDREYIGFEPNPNCLQYSQHLIEVNQFTRCTLVPAGLSSRSALMKLFLNPDVDPSATIVEGFREPERYARSMLVPVYVGDDVLADLGVTDVAVVKIDVEGGELDVVQGLAQTLARSAPYVFCEVLPVFDQQSEMGRFRARRQDTLLELLRSLRYSVFRVYVDHSVEQVTEFGLHADMTRSNYLFVPEAAVAEFRRRFNIADTHGDLARASA